MVSFPYPILPYPVLSIYIYEIDTNCCIQCKHTELARKATYIVTFTNLPKPEDAEKYVYVNIYPLCIYIYMNSELIVERVDEMILTSSIVSNSFTSSPPVWIMLSNTPSSRKLSSP